MERLTYFESGRWWFKIGDTEHSGPIADRLAAYEDTGLEPGDIDALQKREQGLAEILVNISCGCTVTYERLQELAQAEKDGRLVKYLPGDTVYDCFGREWTVTSSEIHGYDDGLLRHLYRCGHPGTDDYYALCADEILTRAEAALELRKEGAE